MTFAAEIRRRRNIFRTAFRRGPVWLPRRKVDGTKYVSPTLLLAWWCYGLLSRVFTPQGWMFFWACLAIGFYATIMTRSPAATFFFILMAMLFFNLLFLLLFFPRISVKRHLPDRVSAGAEFTAEYQIENRSFAPCFDVVADSLLSMKGLSADPPARISVPGHGRAVVRRRFTLAGRGIYDFPAALAETGFPFNILKISRREDRTDRIICHPFRKRLNSIRLPDGAKTDSPSRNPVASTGESMDFHGCREYIPGDEPRKIDWRASARRCKLVVKEFQEERLARAALILDTAVPLTRRDLKDFLMRAITLKPLFPHEAEERFEAGISLAASIVTTLSAADFTLDIFAAGSEIHHLRTGRSMMSEEAFLDILAALVPAHSRKRFEKLQPAVLRDIASTGAVFLILLTPDAEAEELYKSLLKNGAAVRVFALGKPGDVPVWAESVDPRGILGGRRDEL